VATGALTCAACRVYYPIESYVPVLLDFATDYHRRFAAAHAVELAALGGFELPAGEARPGEMSVQETFTDEWDQLHGDELSFSYTQEDLEKLNREVWLRWAAGEQVGTVLEIGCGLGAETTALKRVLGPQALFAVDLNFALLARGEEFSRMEGVHVVIASLFALPFAPAGFDLVYSQGVIHHTYSTRAALEAVAAHVKPQGRCFIWVYGLDDHLVPRGIEGARMRAGWVFENAVRPLVSRAPAPARDRFFTGMTALMHRRARAQTIHSEEWETRNTDHQLRDWLSPRYAHRHSYNELLEWFEALGFEIVDLQSPLAFRRLFDRRLWGVGLTARRP
jgi:SAM-dependent methyltransferase